MPEKLKKNKQSSSITYHFFAKNH